VAALDADSRRPIVEIADVLGWTQRRVRDYVERARGLGYLVREPGVLRRVDWRGIIGGELSPFGHAELWRLLEDRIGCGPGGVLAIDIAGQPGTAAALLRFLTEPRAPSPAWDTASVVAKPSGVEVRSSEGFWGPWITQPDGVTLRFMSR
jgi:hypothetical protein